MTTGLPDFFKYNLWANLRLLDACAQLSDAQLDATTTETFGSVRETLMHLFAAEEGYVWSFTGTTPTPPLMMPCMKGRERCKSLLTPNSCYPLADL